jgi:hypothetical protein
MRAPRPRFTVRSIMVVIATLAVSWPMCLGVGHMTIYRANVPGERARREYALFWEARDEVGKAADQRREAEVWARRNEVSLPYIITALSLIGSGMILRPKDGSAQRAKDNLRTTGGVVTRCAGEA